MSLSAVQQADRAIAAVLTVGDAAQRSLALVFGQLVDRWGRHHIVVRSDSLEKLGSHSYSFDRVSESFHLLFEQREDFACRFAGGSADRYDSQIFRLPFCCFDVGLAVCGLLYQLFLGRFV